ncbi:MAG: radical SAM protein [Bacteroidales bacterium]|nr:radical SAM protein [Bacteroidales bacterium]
MKKVLLIYPKPDEIKKFRFSYSLNLLYAASILRNEGYTPIAYLDFALENISTLRLREYLEETDIVILERDTFPLRRSTNISHCTNLAHLIKTEYPTKLLIGIGNDFAMNFEEEKYFDFIFADSFEDKISGVITHLLNGEKVEKESPTYIKSTQYKKIPYPDRSLLSDYIEHGGSLKDEPKLAKSALIRTSTGCPYSCTFCQRKGWYPKTLSHSPEYVLNEFRQLSDNKYKNIWISDDNFTADLKRAKAILSGLTENKLSQDMKIALSSSVNIDFEFLRLAKDANVSIISFGIESGEDEILAFYKKKIDLSKVKELIEYADSIGLYTVGNFIVGAPMESEKSIAKTTDFLMTTPFDRVNIKLLDYMQGSILYDKLPEKMKQEKRHIFACKENGLNNYSLAELKEISNNISIAFNKSKKGLIAKKNKLFGQPYYMS